MFSESGFPWNRVRVRTPELHTPVWNLTECPQSSKFTRETDVLTTWWCHDMKTFPTLLWRHNGRDGVSNQQSPDCILNWSFGRRSKKTSKHRVTGLCAGNSPVTGEFPAQMTSNAENVFIWWRHHDMFGNLLGTGGFPSQRPVKWSFGFFLGWLIKLLNKHWNDAEVISL